jgi:hypothetical protein
MELALERSGMPVLPMRENGEAARMRRKVTRFLEQRVQRAVKGSTVE